MIFLANLNSKHIHVWELIYRNIPVNVSRIFSIHDFSQSELAEQNKFYRSRSKFKVIAYIKLAFALRKNSKKSDLLHAHGASGYGLSAALSGRRFVATIYGSEIMGSHSWLYRQMIKFVLRRASAITTTSEHARRNVEQLIQESSKIYMFHTGLSHSVIEMVNKYNAIDRNFDNSREITFISFRNCGSQYQTETIIESFNGMQSQFDSKMKLIVIEGNGDCSYFERLRSKYKEKQNIEFIKGLLKHSQLLDLISKSNICINFPSSDQLSTSLLEVLSLKKPLVSIWLESYSSLNQYVDGRQILWCRSADDLRKALIDSVYLRLPPQVLADNSANIIKQFSLENAVVEARLMIKKLKRF